VAQCYAGAPMAHTEGTAPVSNQRGLSPLAQVTRRLVAFLFICYVIAYIDRLNIGFAASALQRDLGLSDSVYGTGAGLFFLGYFLFEIPSNLILERVGARRWMARIMIVWGLLSMGMMFVVGKWSFYGMRVLLGLAEAGFFPGAILYLTYWIPQRARARNAALFMIATPVAILVGAPLSGLLMELDGVLGLRGWQWLFLGEGVPAVIAGIAALFYLTDRPEQAEWLSPESREWLIDEMARDRASAAHGHVTLGASFRSARVWLLSFAYFLNTSVTYSVFLWLPKILEDASGLHGVRLGLLTAIPFVFTLVAMIIVGRHSDRTGERKLHVAACALVGACGLALASVSGSNVPLLLLSFTLCQSAQRSIQPVFWTLPPLLLGGTAAAAGFALINAIGNLGGYAGPSMMGWLKETTGGYAPGMLVLAGGLVVLAAVVASLRLPSFNQ
jgi:MFS transporter, ACS family, tartrate transporter